MAFCPQSTDPLQGSEHCPLMQASLAGQSVSKRQPLVHTPPIQFNPLLQSLALKHLDRQVPLTQDSPHLQSVSRLQFLTQKPLVQSSPALHTALLRLRLELKKLENRFLDGVVDFLVHLKLLEKHEANGSPAAPAGQEHWTS